jgi:hypothetical protein
MNEDFVTRLRLQLREAAEREERGGALARALDVARGAPPALRPAVAVLAVAAALFVAFFAVTTLHPEQPAQAPRIVERFSPSESLGEITYAFGSAWVDDPGGGRVLRIDPRTHRVVARIPVPATVRLAAGTDALWALAIRQSAAAGPLMRIDPSTNRVVRRVRLTMPGGGGVDPWKLLTSPHHIWVLGHRGAVHVDPGAARVTATIRAVGSYGALTDADLWLQQDQDGSRLLRLDPRTGARRAALRMEAPGAPVILGQALLTVGEHEVARIDPTTGRALWRTPVTTPYAWTVAGGRLWIEGRTAAGPADRIAAIDPGTGRITSSVRTGEFGGAGLAGVGSDLWLTTPGGRVVVVRP